MQASLENLQQLNQMKQDRLKAQLVTLNIKEKELQNQIYQKQSEIDKLHSERIDYKVNTYTNKLKNTVIKPLDIKLVEFQLNTFSQEIENTLQKQHNLSNELNKLKQQIKTVQNEIKYYIIKVEKYDYCQTLLVD